MREKTIKPLLVNATDAAAMLGICPSKFRQLVADGYAPPKLHIDRSVRWKVADLEAWVDAGLVHWEDLQRERRTA